MASASEKAEKEILEIRDILDSYEPGSTVERRGRVAFPDTLIIGMFGRTGCGKTSLINSLRYAAKGRLRRAMWLQVAGQEKAGGHTMYRKCVEISKTISVVDNRGMDNLHADAAMKELCAQLAGVRGYSEMVSWSDFVETSKEKMGDRIATAVFVFSAVHNIEETIAGLTSLITIMHNTQGQYPIAVITHVDEASEDDVEEVKAALRAEGVSDSCIFTVANMTAPDRELQQMYELNLLRLLDRCMVDGDQAMIFHHHKQYEEMRNEEILRLKEKEMQEIIEKNRRAFQEAQKQKMCKVM